MVHSSQARTRPAGPAGVRPPFPRSVRTYVGRAGELARVAELLDRETLFLVYGVGGIGKSELVYKAIEDARQTPRWRAAEPLLIPVRAGLTVEHVLAQLRLALDLALPAELPQARSATLDDDLAEIAHALEARPWLVFLDDVHHLDLDQAAHVLGYLSRHVRESRIFAASRIEVPLPPDGPTPAVLRIAPLDAEATAAMVAELARRLGIEGPDATEVFARSGGSPFFVQRLLAGDAGQVESSLERSLRELAAPLRELLLLVAVLRSRIGRDELAAAHRAAAASATVGDAGPGRETGPGANSEANIEPSPEANIDAKIDASPEANIDASPEANIDASPEANIDTWIRDLGRRFLIDVSRDAVMMHDLVRDALMRLASTAEQTAAHAHAARLYERRFHGDPARHAWDALEAVHHLIRADRANAAWAFAASSYPSIAAAGLDHLLIDTLVALRDALAEHRPDMDLLRARILLRRSQVAEAATILASMPRNDDGPTAFRHAMLAGEIAQRQGRLDQAEALFGRAEQSAETSSRKLQAALQRGFVLALRGHNQQARDVAGAALARIENVSARDRGRHDWLISVSYQLEERFEEATDAAAQGRAALAGSGADDLELMLALLEMHGRTECNDVKTARRLLDEVVARAVEAGRLRAPVVEFHRGVVLAAEGDMRAARATLESSSTHLRGHADHMLAVMAGYYFARALVAQGQAVEAVRLTEHMNDVARAAGLATLVSNSMAMRAEALLAAGRLRQAKKQALLVLQNPRVQSNARWGAQATLMRCLAIEGDLAGAREVHARATAEGRERHRLAAQLERATIETLIGDANAAVAAGLEAWQGFAAQGQRWREATAAATLSAALVVRGRATDLAAVDEPLARAEDLAGRGGYPLVRAISAMVRASLLARAGDRQAGIALLMDTARAISAAGDGPEVIVLQAGLEESAPVPPGLRALARRLGLSAGPRYRLADRAGVRTATEQDVEHQRQNRELVVEPARAMITVRGGESESGRPLTCELLARLIEGQGQVVAADALFRDVWGGRDYHPLRHRNTVYVAVKRLRQTLRKLLGERNVIETAAGGWRMADDIDAASIRPADAE
jgi:DNA-binding response OmpR family regulator/tetratricopeptide (TPR) repeat protein